MKIMSKTIYMILFMVLFMAAPAYADIFVIVNPGNTVSSLSLSELKSIYLMKKRTWNTGRSIAPVYLVDQAARFSFSEKVFGQKPNWIEKYYLKRSLTGKGQPPKTVATDKDVVSYVSSNRDAIGYVLSTDSSVKIVLTIKD